MKPIELYRELGRRVSPFIKHYRSDLKHDKAWILDNPSVEFVHWTGVSSTHIVSLDAYDSERWPADGLQVPYLFGLADREHILTQKREACEALNEKFNIRVIYFWDGFRLQEINAKRAKHIVDRYVSEVRSAWNPKVKPRNLWVGERGFVQLQAA